MSYSFNVRAASKDAAIEALAPEFDKVVVAQPIHERDVSVHRTVAEAQIALVDEPGTNQEIMVTVAGSIAVWDGQTTHANVSVNVSVLSVPTT